MIFRDEGPYGGPMLCSNDRVTCTTSPHCGGNLRGVRLRLGESPNPFVSSEGSSESYGRCVATMGSLGPIAAGIASYTPTSSERVALTTVGLSCLGRQEIRASARDGDVVITLGGGLQVIDVDHVNLGGRARLRLRGQDDTVLLIRVGDHLRLGARAAVVLEDNGLGLGELAAERVLWTVQSTRARVSLGAFSQFAGTLLSSGERGIRVGSAATIDGALFGKRVQLGNSSAIVHAPFTAPLP